MGHYDFFVGRDGVKEINILDACLNAKGFKFMPGNKFERPTVKIWNYYFLNKENKPCSILDVKKDEAKVFLHGTVHTWNGFLPAFVVGNVKVTEWFVFIFNP